MLKHFPLYKGRAKTNVDIKLINQTHHKHIEAKILLNLQWSQMARKQADCQNTTIDWLTSYHKLTYYCPYLCQASSRSNEVVAYNSSVLHLNNFLPFIPVSSRHTRTFHTQFPFTQSKPSIQHNLSLLSMFYY